MGITSSFPSVSRKRTVDSIFKCFFILEGMTSLPLLSTLASEVDEEDIQYQVRSRGL